MDWLLAIFTIFSSIFSEMDETEKEALEEAIGEPGEDADWLEIARVGGGLISDAVPTMLETGAKITLASDFGLLEGIGGSEGKSAGDFLKKYAVPIGLIVGYLFLSSSSRS